MLSDLLWLYNGATAHWHLFLKKEPVFTRDVPYTVSEKCADTFPDFIFFPNIVNEYNTPLISLSICRQPPFLKILFFLSHRLATSLILLTVLHLLKPE